MGVSSLDSLGLQACVYFNSSNALIISTRLSKLDGATAELAYLHAQVPIMIHGDIHPGNILVNDAGEALLCDFGFSRLQHEVTRTRSLIREGGVGRYLAPELSSGPAKFRTERSSDIYSMGMVFFALVSGSAPFIDLGEYGAIAAAQRDVRLDRRNIKLILPLFCEEHLWIEMQEMQDMDPGRRPNAFEVITRMSNVLERFLF